VEKADVLRLFFSGDAGEIIGLFAADDLVAAISDELAHLTCALRGGIEREQAGRPKHDEPLRRPEVFASSTPQIKP